MTSSCCPRRGCDRHLAEQQPFAERAEKQAFELQERVDERRRRARRRSQRDQVVAVLTVLFVGREELHAILDDRAAHGPAPLPAFVGRLRLDALPRVDALRPGRHHLLVLREVLVLDTD